MRDRNTRAYGGSFDEATIEAVWEKGTPESFSYFSKDACGASMFRPNFGKEERWGWEIDHIKPVSLGGTDDIDNLRPLQWENNRAKGESFPDSEWTCVIRS